MSVLCKRRCEVYACVERLHFESDNDDKGLPEKSF